MRPAFLPNEKAERNAFRFFVMQKPGRIAPRFYLDMDEKRRKTVGAIHESPVFCFGTAGDS